MKFKSLFSFTWTGLLLLSAFSGCGGEIKKAEYPGTWPSRTIHSPTADCPDISGTYKITKDHPLLPFLLFGIVDERSPEWESLIQVYEQHFLSSPEDGTVSITLPDSDHIEIIVALQGITIANQLLTRSNQSENNAQWLGQNSQSFRCESDSIVINSSYVHDWEVYTLPLKEKKNRYRRLYGVIGPLGVSEGYFYFSKTIKGSLVMRAHRYGCYPCNSLDEFWWQWEPMYDTTHNQK